MIKLLNLLVLIVMLITSHQVVRIRASIEDFLKLFKYFNLKKRFIEKI